MAQFDRFKGFIGSFGKKKEVVPHVENMPQGFKDEDCHIHYTEQGIGNEKKQFMNISVRKNNGADIWIYSVPYPYNTETMDFEGTTILQIKNGIRITRDHLEQKEKELLKYIVNGQKTADKKSQSASEARLES